jgi:hypothetical protein
MAYDKFNILTSTAVPLYRKCRYGSNYSCSFLKATERVGFGDNLSVIGDNNDDSPNQFSF